VTAEANVVKDAAPQPPAGSHPTTTSTGGATITIYKTVTVTGRHYRLAGETCSPRPQQRHVPLLVGGGGRRVLAIAARQADIVGFTGLGRTANVAVPEVAV